MPMGNNGIYRLVANVAELAEQAKSWAEIAAKFAIKQENLHVVTAVPHPNGGHYIESVHRVYQLGESERAGLVKEEGLSVADAALRAAEILTKGKASVFFGQGKEAGKVDIFISEQPRRRFET